MIIGTMAFIIGVCGRFKALGLVEPRVLELGTRTLGLDLLFVSGLDTAVVWPW